MKSKTTAAFRKAFSRLPRRIQAQARDAFRQFLQDPQHPGLQFKRVHTKRRIYSVRVTLDYRAIGVREGDLIIWYWIGSHEEYDRLVSR